MAQGEATKQEAKEITNVFKEVFHALPKKRQMEFIGHANDIYLFLGACERVLPDETKPETDGP